MDFKNKGSKEWTVELDDEVLTPLQNAFLRGDDDSEDNPYIIKHFVGYATGKVKVEIFSNEDPPPHFRVIYQNSTANYKISDCSRRDGSGQVLKYERKIRRWWGDNKKLLIDTWNDKRPTDCPVGVYKE